jgi:hypothetical protein
MVLVVEPFNKIDSTRCGWMIIGFCPFVTVKTRPESSREAFAY